MISRDELLKQLDEGTKEFIEYCHKIDSAKFFHQPFAKWSVAQNVAHLVTSANMTRLAFRLPKFLVRVYSGKPNRPSRSYNELVNKYKLKLQEGGKAKGRFDTDRIDPNVGKEKIMNNFTIAMHILSRTIKRRWKDAQLDTYLAPHPLLGKLTLRELIYFTIYHTQHHLQIIRERLTE